MDTLKRIDSIRLDTHYELYHIVNSDSFHKANRLRTGEAHIALATRDCADKVMGEISLHGTGGK